MAHYVAISKASFAAGLLRPNPTSVSREDIAHFHALLDAVIVECSPANVQVWLNALMNAAARRLNIVDEIRNVENGCWRLRRPLLRGSRRLGST